MWRTPATDALIERERYRWIRMWENAPVTPENARQVLREAERALRELGRHEESREAATPIPERLVIE